MARRKVNEITQDQIDALGIPGVSGQRRGSLYTYRGDDYGLVPVTRWHKALNKFQNWAKGMGSVGKPVDLKNPDKNDPRVIWNFTGKE
jgi:hypothetical protein